MRLDNAVKLAQELVDISSVSGEEKVIADAIEAALRKLPHLEVIRDGDAVMARTNLGRSQRIILAGHIDTVPVARNLPSRLLPEGTLWGRGAVDMKAGDAVFLYLAAQLKDPRCDITWVFYDHEEVEAKLNGLGRLVRNYPTWFEADFAVLGEPTNASLEGGCNGTLRVKVQARGVAAHSARPWMGENAVHKLLPALTTLASWEPHIHTVGGLDFKESLVAVGIQGGTGANSVPDEAHVIVNFRFAPDRNPAQAEEYVRSLFPNYDVQVTDCAAGAHPDMNHPECGKLARLLEQAGGNQSSAKLGWTDVARFSSLGIPAVNCGPGDPLMAHKDDEACPIEQIERLVEVFTSWLR